MKFYTYQDLAAVWQVHPKTVSRWVLRLEKKRGLVVFRPTRTTIRLSEDNVTFLMQQREIRYEG